MEVKGEGNIVEEERGGSRKDDTWKQLIKKKQREDKWEK